MLAFIQRQVTEVAKGGKEVLFKKLKLFLLRTPWFIIAFPIVLIMRLIRPLFLIRIGGLFSSRIGHFASNTELYICEYKAGINKPRQRHIDILYFAYKPICNQQLATMWKRLLPIWPEWFMACIVRINRIIPGGVVHEIGDNTQNDRDVHNLLDQFPPNLQFTDEEITRGESNLRIMGIPENTPFVCLIVRDSAYLDNLTAADCNYHNYRDSDIQNYVLASEELADRGYFVIRMGAKVHQKMNSSHQKIINYATNGMRTDFMDIYLGAKCEFCISTGTGWDEVCRVFRRPIVNINLVPIGYLHTYRAEFLSITKKYVLKESQRVLALKEIFNYGVGLSLESSDYEIKGVHLIENTPEEIRDVVMEMVDRLNGSWQTHEEDDDLQKLFWKIFPTDTVAIYNGQPLHGEVRARFGAKFLRNNRDWLK